MPEDELRWLRREVEVLFDLDASGRLLAVNEPDPEGLPPRLFIARGRADVVARVRADVPDAVAQLLLALAAELPRWDGHPGQTSRYEPLRTLLDAAVAAGRMGDGEISHGPAFVFPPAASPRPAGDSAEAEIVLVDTGRAGLLERHFPWTRRHLAERSPVVGAVVDGAIVSACFCARRRPDAAEAGVETIDAHRGRGLGTRVVARWAGAAEQVGITPLYSTTWDNATSLRIAASLGLHAYAETVELP